MASAVIGGAIKWLGFVERGVGSAVLVHLRFSSGPVHPHSMRLVKITMRAGKFCSGHGVCNRKKSKCGVVGKGSGGSGVQVVYKMKCGVGP